MSTFQEQMNMVLQEKAHLQQRAELAERLVCEMLGAARGGPGLEDEINLSPEAAEVYALRKEALRAEKANKLIDLAERRAREAERLAGSGEKACEAAVRAFVHRWSEGCWVYKNLPVPLYQAVLHLYGYERGYQIVNGMLGREENYPHHASERWSVIAGETDEQGASEDPGEPSEGESGA